MRLDLLSELSGIQRVFGSIATMLIGQLPGPIQCFSYRKKLFGIPASGVFQEAMRGASTWTVAERELMAAFVSKTNSCAY